MMGRFDSLEDHYSVLGLKRDAAQDEIKKAYRKLAKIHHPDSNPGDAGAEKRFIKISNAYNTLFDSAKRTAYDDKLSYGGQATGGGRAGESNQSSQKSTTSGQNYDPAAFARSSGSMFENFFGFDPKSKEHNLHNKDENIKPMKTKDAYAHIFGKKRF